METQSKKTRPIPATLILSLLAIGCGGQAVDTQGGEVMVPAQCEAAVTAVDGLATERHDLNHQGDPDAQVSHDTRGGLTAVTPDCRVTPLAQVYQPGTDRLTAPFLGTNPETIVIYLDGVPVPRGSWGLADDGHTLVLTQDVPGGHMVGFSIGCTRLPSDEGDGDE